MISVPIFHSAFSKYFLLLPMFFTQETELLNFFVPQPRISLWLHSSSFFLSILERMTVLLSGAFPTLTSKSFIYFLKLKRKSIIPLFIVNLSSTTPFLSTYRHILLILRKNKNSFSSVSTFAFLSMSSSSPWLA